MKQKHNNKLIPGTKFTVKEFKELIFAKFKSYPKMYMDYQKNQFKMAHVFYENDVVTLKKLIEFCDKLGVIYNLDYTKLSYSKSIIIELK